MPQMFSKGDFFFTFDLITMLISMRTVGLIWAFHGVRGYINGSKCFVCFPLA